MTSSLLRYSKKENAILLYFEKPFKQAAIIFYFIGTLIVVARWKRFIYLQYFTNWDFDWKQAA